MSKLRFTNLAVQDLTDIWDYTVESWSVKQAERYYRLIIDACEAIAANPETGKGYNLIFPELKGKKISKRIIFYREIGEKTIEITRILHERMELNDPLKK